MRRRASAATAARSPRGCPSRSSTTWRHRSCASPASISPTRHRTSSGSTCRAPTASSTPSRGCSGRGTMPDFLLPDLGEGLEEAEVVAWRAKPGDRVVVDQVIAEVETAKAVVEVPVPYAGVVAALHAAAGSTVSVGQPLLTVEAEEPAAGFREPGVVVPEQGPAGANGVAGVAAGPAAEDAAARGAPGGDEEASGSVLIGYGTGSGTAPTRSRRGRRRGAPAAPPAAPAPAAPDR